VIFEPAGTIPGALMVGLERNEDERGFFARIWCRDEFAAQGISVDIAQASVSHNAVAGTLRGLHFQWPPSREAKLVRCERGRVYDVILDLRPDSPAFLQHVTVVLDDDRRNALYIPPGVAHGFQTLAADSDVVYMMSDFYKSELQSGVRWNDPAFGIVWPITEVTILARDANYPDFDPAAFAREYKRRATA
jgi:dTDP-4-dehydrorhamnose 3,5-epimerase